WPAADIHLRFFPGSSALLAFHDEMPHMLRFERGADRGHRAHFRYLRGRGEDRRAAEAVADEDLGRAMMLAQVARGGHQIADVGRELEAGEVEAKQRDTAGGERLADVGCRLAFLRAG